MRFPFRKESFALPRIEKAFPPSPTSFKGRFVLLIFFSFYYTISHGISSYSFRMKALIKRASSFPLDFILRESDCPQQPTLQIPFSNQTRKNPAEIILSLKTRSLCPCPSE